MRNRDDFELPPTPHRIGRSVDDEVQAHLDERIAELMARGLSRDDAATLAHREFGDVNAARADLRRIDERAARVSSLRETLYDIVTDARRALRGLARRPAFSLVAIGTLALGIGANAVMFGLIDRLLLSAPPHVRNGEEIVRMMFDEVDNGGGRITWIRGSHPVYRLFAERQDLFSGVAAYWDRPLTLAVGDQAVELRVAAVTPSFFDVLGLRAAAGRVLTSDATNTDDRSVVLSHAMWQRHLGGTDAAIGKHVRLGGEMFTVVGVAPAGFSGDGIQEFDAWIRLGPATPILGAQWMNAGVFTFARLKPDVHPTHASNEATRLYRAWRADQRSPDSTARVLFRSLLAGRNTDTGAMTSAARVAIWLQGVSLLVLLVAVANVVNLLLLRAIERQRETSVRLALGITRSRLVRHLSLESVLLAAAGCSLAVALARWLGPALWTLVLPQATDAGALVARLTAVTASIAVVCAVVMTLVPAAVLRASSGSDALRAASRGASRQTSRIGEALVVMQVTLTVVLLVGAGLFVRSAQRLGDIDMGFNPAQLIGARVSPAAGTPPAVRTAMFARVEDALRRMPSVEGVSMGLSSPLRPSLNVPFRLPGRETLPGVGVGGAGLGYPTFFAVSPEFLATMGVRVLRGRGITSTDVQGSARVMLVDATMAKTFWPGEEAIGRCVQIGADSLPCTTVVGVVQDTKRTLTETRHSLRYYVPIDQSPYRGSERYFFVRSPRVDARMVDAVRAAVAAAAPSAPFVEAFPMERLLSVYMQQWQLGVTAFVTFGGLATLIATIGLFGVVSFGVARRERELGIRRALGESRASVVRRVVRHAMVRSAAGVALGGLLSLGLGRRLQELLFRPTASDSWVFVIAVSIVVVATMVASAAPALRAMRADPMQALRAE